MLAQQKRTAILWFRNDLRLHDNESLNYAVEHFDNVVPVYVFDRQLMEGETSYGFEKVGEHRIKFYIESVLALKDALQKKGSDLIIQYGNTGEILSEFCQMYNASYVLCNRERTTEEVYIQNDLEQILWKKGVEILFFRGKMLYYTADLPFPIKHTPDTFSQFKKELYKVVPIREPLIEPDTIPTVLRSTNISRIPLEIQTHIGGWGVEKSLHIIGGEEEAILRLYLMETFLESGEVDLYETDSFEEYYTTHLSPWLANGCLSPKLLYQTILPFAEAEKTRYVVQKIINNLLYRDFCRFMAKKYANLIFWSSGVKGDRYAYGEIDDGIVSRFIIGKTGIPLVDAQVRKLLSMGYLTAKARRILASFFIFDLKQPWLYGAEFFESQLVDYDPASNYVNWGILADIYYETVGNAHINIVHQSERYDPEAKFIKRWVPELSKVDEELIHYPWKWEPAQRKRWNLPESKYPSPIVSPRYSLV